MQGDREYCKERGALHTSFSKIRIESLYSHDCHIYYLVLRLWIQVNLIKGYYRENCLYGDAKYSFSLKLEEINEVSNYDLHI